MTLLPRLASSRPRFGSAAAAVVLVLALAAPAFAQGLPSADDLPAVSLRGFFLVSGQAFTARETFTAIFGQRFEPFWGGGAEVALRDGVFVNAALSRFRKTGQRAFFFNDQAYRLGLGLETTVTPFEVTGGYRFLRLSRYIVPYAGAGVGSYAYTERSTDANADPTESMDTRHVGYLVVAGAEFRLHRWVGLAADAQYTHIPGILGAAGVSQQTGERDLGGTAVRLRVIVGR